VVPFEVQLLIGFGDIYLTADILQLFYLSSCSFVLIFSCFIYDVDLEITVEKYETKIHYISYNSVNTNGYCISSQISRTLFVQ